jgi:subfamily B ATP-binding cassette protein MsbA
LSILVGVLDGFGITMFLPLLQLVNDSTSVDPNSMGNLSFIIYGLQRIGLNIDLVTILFVMLLFFILKGLFSFTSLTYKIITQQLFIRTLRIGMISALNNMKFKVFVKSNAGRIQNTMTGEVGKVVQGFESYFQTFQHGVLVSVYMGFAFFVDLQFAILVTIGGALTNILYRSLYKHTKGASIKLTSASNTYQGQVIQYVGNFKYLKATGLAGFFGERLKSTILEIESVRKRIDTLGAILIAAREPMLMTVVVTVILFQVIVLSGSLGGILISLLFFYRALNALTSLQNSWNKFLAVSGSMENIQDFQKELLKAQETQGKIKLEEFSTKLTLKDGTFSFGDFYILFDINLNIYKNETIAFVGESGSGKTTLVNVITGLLPLNKGEYLIDNYNSKDLDLISFQNRVGYITQEPIIFNDTIYNNVTLWSENNLENQQRFYKAITAASLFEYVENLDAKGDSLLGNNGINLSGGQKQRICIARELFKEIDILIMDEATSALDSETEKIIQENIDNLKGKYTILIVAHRLSTIKNADRIVFMKKGRIESIGTYIDLLNSHKSFKKMVELQEL